MISEQYDDIQLTKSPEEFAAGLSEFHTRLAERLHNGEFILDMVPE